MLAQRREPRTNEIPDRVGDIARPPLGRGRLPNMPCELEYEEGIAFRAPMNFCQQLGGIGAAPLLDEGPSTVARQTAESDPFGTGCPGERENGAAEPILLCQGCEMRHEQRQCNPIYSWREELEE